MKHDAFERKNPVNTPKENLQVVLDTLRGINRMDTLYTIRTNIEAAIPVVLKITESDDYSTLDAVVLYIENAKFAAARLGCNSLFSIVFAEWYVWEIIADVTTVELVEPLESESPIGTIVPKKGNEPSPDEIIDAFNRVPKETIKSAWESVLKGGAK